MKCKCRECSVEFNGSESLEHCPVCYELCHAERRTGPNDTAPERITGPKDDKPKPKPSPPLPVPVKKPAARKTLPVPIFPAKPTAKTPEPTPRGAPTTPKPVPKVTTTPVQKPAPKLSPTPASKQSPSVSPPPSLPKPVIKAVLPVPIPKVRTQPAPKRVMPNPPPPSVVLPRSLIVASTRLTLGQYLLNRSTTSEGEEGSPKRRKIDTTASVSPVPPKSVSPPPLPDNSVWAGITDKSLVLLIGEGNFSFAYSLAKRVGTGKSMIATDVEMHHELQDNIYNHPNCIEGGGVCFGKLIELGTTISCGIDVAKLSVTKPLSLLVGSLDYMSWAFPHTRTPNRDVNCIPEHRNLLRTYIDEAAKMLKLGGKALITVKEGYPYNSWDVAGLKTKYVEYMACEPFFPKDFPEYTHVTTIGAPITEITPATTHVFKKVAEPDGTTMDMDTSTVGVDVGYTGTDAGFECDPFDDGLDTNDGFDMASMEI